MSLQYLASFSINLRPRKENLSPPGVNKRINKICRIVRRTQRHHSIETNFFCFKDDFEWKVKARDRFQFFLLSLNLKNMLIVIPFGNKNNWENYTFYEIAKSLRLIGVFFRNFYSITRISYCFMLKTQFHDFYDFMTSDNPVIQAYTDINRKL